MRAAQKSEAHPLVGASGGPIGNIDSPHLTTIHNGVKIGIRTGFVTGQRLKRCAHPERLAYWPENKSLMAELFRHHWLEMLPSDMVDGWFATGSRGQAWEYGPGKLGFTVTRAKAIRGVLKDFGKTARVTQHGDDEANFAADWTSENLGRIARRLRLYRRRGGPQACAPQAAPSQNPNLGSLERGESSSGTRSDDFEADGMHYELGALGQRCDGRQNRHKEGKK